MSNLSEGLIEQGREEGKLQGIIKTVVDFINYGIPQEEAFKITNADENIQKAVIDLLLEKQK